MRTDKSFYTTLDEPRDSLKKKYIFLTTDRWRILHKPKKKKERNTFTNNCIQKDAGGVVCRYHTRGSKSKSTLLLSGLAVFQIN